MSRLAPRARSRTSVWDPGPGAPLGDDLQLRAGERGPGDEAGGLLPAGEPGVAQAPRERGRRHDVPERGPGAGEADGAAVDEAGGSGDDQGSVGRGTAFAHDVLPHVPGDGGSRHMGNPRARAADRGPTRSGRMSSEEAESGTYNTRVARRGKEGVNWLRGLM